MEHRPAEAEPQQRRTGRHAFRGAREDHQRQEERRQPGQRPATRGRPGCGGRASGLVSFDRVRRWTSMLMDFSLSQWWMVALRSRVVASARAHPGQMAGMCRTAAASESAQVEPGQLAARGDTCLGEDVAQVEGDRARRDPALRGHVLVGHARADELGDLELRRGELQQRRGVALARRLARGAQLLIRPRGQRTRPARPGRSRGRDAGGRGRPRAAGCDAATRRTPARRAPRPEVDLRSAPSDNARSNSGSASASAVRALPNATAESAHGRRVASAKDASSSVQARAVATSPARTAASIRSVADRRSSTGSRMRPSWWKAPEASPVLAARMPMAHRVRSCTGSAMMPSGWVATSSSSRIRRSS